MDGSVEIRPAGEHDRLPMAHLFAAVAGERDGIAAEPPIDAGKWAERWHLDGTFVAVEIGEIVGVVSVDPTPFGYGELGMFVGAGSRGRGVGTALVEAAIDWSRANGLHKVTLGVFPHNDAAIALYRKFGFVDEGLRVEHIRRKNGELWDLLEMGLPLR